MVAVRLISLLPFFLTPTFALPPLRIQKGDPGIQDTAKSSHSPLARVPVVLGLMGKSRKALICEAFFDRVLRKVGHDKVELTLSFVGGTHRRQGEGYDVSCLPGAECQGDIHQLCVIRQYSEADSEVPPFRVIPTLFTPPDAQHIWWSFTQCLNRTPALIGEEARARECTEEVGVDWDAPGGVGECVNGEEGKKVLAWSMLHSEGNGVKYGFLGGVWEDNSRLVDGCSIYVSGSRHCLFVSDLKQCTVPGVSDFAELIESEYRKLNSLNDGSSVWV